MDQKMIVNFYNSVYEAYVHKDDPVHWTFDEFVDFLHESQKELESKENGILYNCLKYRSDYISPDIDKFKIPDQDKNDYIRRCKDNVEEIYCLLLDVDGTMTLDETVEKYCDYEFVVYSTHGNRTDKEKFRLILPIKTPMTLTEFDERHFSMVNNFNVDGASFTISQAFYLPSYSSENKKLAYIYHNKTDDRFDALELETTEIYQDIETVPFVQDGRANIKNGIYHTLMTGSDLHYVDALPLAILCKSKGLSVYEFKNIVKQIAHPNSDLRTKKVDLQKLYRQGYESNITDRKAIELMKRLNCNMWRFEIAKKLR